MSHWLAAIDQWKCCIDSYANKIWVSKHSSKDDCPNQILITTLYFLWQDLQNKTAFNYTSIIFFYVIICSKKVYFARNILFCYWNICFVPRRISIFAKNLLFCWNTCVSSEHFKKFKKNSEHFWQLSRTLWVVLTFFTSQSNGTFWNVFKQILQEHFKTFKTFFKHFMELPRTLWVVLKHFSPNNLKCLQTPSGTFWMFMNILKSSNGTFWNVPQQISSWTFLVVLKKISKIFLSLISNIFHSTLWFEMFTNMFGNFLNVQEHFKKFQWNILKLFVCSRTF